MARTTLTLLLTGSLGSLCLAQGGTFSQNIRMPVFEVSSIRHNTTGDTMASARWSPGRFSAVNARLDTLVLEAFEIPLSLAQIQVRGGIRFETTCTRNCSSREEILSARFDIQATISGDLLPGQRSSALRVLLEDRFKLKAHVETDNRPVYALTIAREGRLGPRLRPSSHNCEAWAKERKEAIDRGVSIPSPTDADGKPLCTGGNMSRVGDFVYVRKGAGEISSLVGNIRGDLPFLIVDRTGLVGNFEWELTSLMPGFGDFGADLKPKAPRLEDALQEQLGLRLVRSTTAVQMLVIESVAMPTPN